MVKHSIYIIAALTGLLGCQKTITDGTESVFDEALVNTYRNALPTYPNLIPPTPLETIVVSPGTPAALAPALAEQSLAPVKYTFNLMNETLIELTSFPPTLYNEDTTQLVWGPFEARKDFGTLALFVSQNTDYNPNYFDEEEPAGSPLEYLFALMRGANYDLNTLTPIVLGGSTPNAENPEWGITLLVFDFNTNKEFVEAYGKVSDPGCLASGRFVALRNHGPLLDEEGAPTEKTLTSVAGIFRNFIPKNAPGASPIDIDYLYGDIASPDSTLSYSNFGAQFDFDGVPETLENVAVKMAFWSYLRRSPASSGRAEFVATNDTMAEGQFIQATECWDYNLSKSYFNMASIYGEEITPLTTMGTPITSCDDSLENGLDAIGLPSTEEADPKIKDLLEDIAQNGLLIDAGEEASN
jgi:hypothetical protein